MIPAVETFSGTSPVILAFPHTGTWVPDGIVARRNGEGIKLRDTDWHVHELYAGLLPEATTVRATFHRYVIDANRDPSGESLYPGQNTTGLVPLTDFDNAPIWREGEEPTEVEVAERTARFHRPYHAALEAEIARLRGLHDKIVLYDCHSIRSVLPRLFAGRLPVFNLGTNDGKAADAGLQERVASIMAGTGRSWAVNGRFKGGWITRHHGRPGEGVHALQMELSNRGYLREPEGKGAPENWPVPYDPDFAVPMRTVLTRILETCLEWATERGQYDYV